MHTDERPVFRIEHRAVDVKAVRIRTIQHDHPHVVVGTGLHHVMHRRQVRIIAQADVLDVEQHDVELFHILGGRAFIGPVNRNDRDPRPGVPAVGNVFACVGIAAKPVFRRENHFQIHSQRIQRIHDMRPTDTAGMVSQYPHPLTFDQRQVPVGALGPDDHAVAPRNPAGQQRKNNDQ